MAQNISAFSQRILDYLATQSRPKYAYAIALGVYPNFDHFPRSNAGRMSAITRALEKLEIIGLVEHVEAGDGWGCWSWEYQIKPVESTEPCQEPIYPDYTEQILDQNAADSEPYYPS